MNNEAIMLLRKLGVSQRLKGYNYVAMAVQLILEDDSKLHTICKVYERVAEAMNTTATRTERAIRHISEVIWADGDRDLLNQLACRELKRRPTNGEFLELLVFGVKNGIPG